MQLAAFFSCMPLSWLSLKIDRLGPGPCQPRLTQELLHGVSKSTLCNKAIEMTGLRVLGRLRQRM
jgi:hypothetical protein